MEGKEMPKPKEKITEKTTDEPLFIGVDLGTARSAICSSNNHKEWTRSIVGWPKDMISRKLLKKDILFGDEALKNRLALDIYRPLERGSIKKGSDKNEEAAFELIKYLINLAGPKPYQKVFVVVGAPAEASQTNKESLKEALKPLADGVMIVSEPFTVAYYENALSNSMIVDIGAGTTDFCVMHGTIPTDEDQATIYEAGDHIDEQLHQSLAEAYPQATFNRTMIINWKEEHAFVGGKSGSVNVTIPVGGKPIEFDIAEDMKRACESIVPSVLEVLKEMIAGYDPEFQEELRQNIILAGGGSLIKGIDKAFEEGLKSIGGAKIRCVENPLYCGALGALAIAQDTPLADWQKLGL